MGFALKGFLAGAATAVSERIDKDEKTAIETARTATENMYRNVLENKKKRQEEIAKYSDNIVALKTHFPDATEEQLYAAALNKNVMEGFHDAVKSGKDFSNVKMSDIVTVADTAPTGKKAQEMLQDSINKANVATPPPVPEGLGFFRTRAENIQRKEIETRAKALGVPVGEMYGAMQPVSPITPPEGATYNMSQLSKPQSVEQQQARILSDLTAAKNSGDSDKVAAATEAAAQFSASQRLMSASLSADQRLIDQIMAQPENAKLSPEAQLRKRQMLEMRPGEGVQKLSASDISRAARGAFNDALAISLGAGKFSTVTNPTTGETTTVPKDLVKPEELNVARTAARQGIINLYTDPRTGLPVSNLHKNALIEIGAQFNQDGSVVSANVAKQQTSQQQPAPQAATPTVESILKSQGVAYEPDKYDYRIEQNGSVASRPKKVEQVAEPTTPKAEDTSSKKGYSYTEQKQRADAYRIAKQELKALEDTAPPVKKTVRSAVGATSNEISNPEYESWYAKNKSKLKELQSTINANK